MTNQNLNSGQCTYRNQHKVTFTNCSTASKERYNKHYYPDNYQYHWNGEKLFIDELRITIVDLLNQHTHGKDNNT